MADVVVPNGFESTAGTGQFFLTTSTGGRTYQMMFSAAQLSSVTGQNIVGLQLRTNEGAAAWPPATVNFTDFEVYLGAGINLPDRTTNFANNYSGVRTQVRAGAIQFDPGAFTSGSNPNAFGPAINFNSSYLYTGGNLVVEFRISAQTGSTVQPAFDAVSNTTAGYGTDYAASFATSFTATTGTATTTSALVTNLITAPVPEPASMAALGIGALALLRRRRSK